MFFFQSTLHLDLWLLKRKSINEIWSVKNLDNYMHKVQFHEQLIIWISIQRVNCFINRLYVYITIGNLHINCDKDMYHMFIKLACLLLSGRYKIIITQWLFLCSHKIILFLPWIKSFKCSPCKSLVSQKTYVCRFQHCTIQTNCFKVLM